MVNTRHASRQAAGNNESPKSTGEQTPQKGIKRKAGVDQSPQGKRGRKIPKQQTLEESLENGNAEPKDENADQPSDIEMKEAAADGEGTDKPVEPSKIETEHGKAPDEQQKAEAADSPADAGIEESEVKEMIEKTAKAEEEQNTNQNSSNGHNDQRRDSKDKTPSQETKDAVAKDDGGVIEHATDRKDKMPSNILEKGIIYFFTRGRVGVEEPDSVQDLQRTYFVLRPIPNDAKIGEGALEDEKTARLIAIPKKVLPKSGRDRFMVFVEKAGVSMKELKDEFFQGSEYETKTVGTRQTPPVAPLGEGVYALTTTGGTSHLAYMMTIPKTIGEVQTDMGLREQGSFVTSLKNPTVSGPAYASLPEKPDYPDEFIKDFGARSWMPVDKAAYLDYPNAQLLLIGEGEDKFANALAATEKDKKHDKVTPQEELEKLENEDELRVEHLKGDDTIFADLGISKNEYPDVMTTW